MAGHAQVLLFGMGIDGDLPLNVVTPHLAYFAGQAAAIGALGLDKSLDHTTFIGMFKNNSTEDDVQGPEVDDVQSPEFTSASVIPGGQKVQISQDAANQVFKFPPTTGGAWLPGQEIFWNGASFFWDNIAETGGDAPLGRVVKIPLSATDDMHVYLYPASISHVV